MSDNNTMVILRLEQDITGESTEKVPPTLSVIVPVYNEQATVIELLTKVLEESTNKELIIVDDGSCDETSDLISAWVAEKFASSRSTTRIVWLEHETNLGKGAAIRSGLQLAMGEYVVIQDADLEVFPSEYPKLLAPLVLEQANFVIGSRDFGSQRRLSFHRLGVRLLNGIVRLVYGYRLSDAACCFKVLKRSDLLDMKLECREFEFCPEVISKASRMNLKVAEVPVSYCSRNSAAGKKLRLIDDGWKAIQTLFRYRNWNPDNSLHLAERNIDEHTIK